MSELSMQVETAGALKGLESLKTSVRRGVLRKAIRAATKAPREKLKRSAPKRSGALRKAMTSKVSTKPRKDTVSGVAGPNRKYNVATRAGKGKFVSGVKQVAKKAKSADAVMGVRPSRYAHLAGKGRTADYMHEVATATRQRQIDDFTKVAKQEIEKEAHKALSKSAASG